MKSVSRNKAWIGAAISAAAGLANGIIQARQKKKAQQEAQRQANEDAIMQSQANLTDVYNNQDYLDNYYDRVQLIPQFLYGGRKKATLGTIFEGIGNFLKTDNGRELLNSGISSLGNVAGSAISSAPTTSVYSPNAFKPTVKTSLVDKSYNLNNSNIEPQYYDRFPQAKFGKRVRGC